MSSSEVVQLIAVVRECTSHFIAALPHQPQTLPDMPAMVTDGEGLYEANLRLVLRYLKHVNKSCKRQGALDSSTKVLQHRAIVKQIHDVDNWPAKLSLPFDIPTGVKETAEKVATAEALRQSLNASWPTNYLFTTASTLDTSTSSLPLGTSECNKEMLANAVQLGENGGDEGTTVPSLSIAPEGLVPETNVADQAVENEPGLTCEIDNTVSTEACMEESPSVDSEIAFRFQGKSTENPLSPSPPGDLRTFRFRHASDSYPPKSHDIDSYTHQNRAVSLPIRCEGPVLPCYLKWSGETLQEFICGVEVEDVKLYNKVRWLALLQEPEAAEFLGRWPSPATLKEFMQMHGLEWVVRARGKWDWESKMAGKESADCDAVSTEELSTDRYTDSGVDRDSLDNVWVHTPVENHGENSVISPTAHVQEPTNDEPIDNEPIDDEPIDDKLADDELANDETTNDETNDELTKDAPLKDEPLKDEPLKDEPLKDEPLKDEPLKDEPLKDEPLKDEPLKDEPTKDDSTTDEATKDQLLVINSDVNESSAENLVATQSSIAAPHSPSWSITSILAGTTASGLIISALCPALTAVVLYIGISYAKSRLRR